MDFYIAISCIILMYVLGIRLSIYNIKVARENRARDVEARRKYKKIKNERLKKFLGL